MNSTISIIYIIININVLTTCLILFHIYIGTFSQNILQNLLESLEWILFDWQVKGLSIEHEKLAVAQRHAAENNNSSTDTGDGGGGSGGASSGSGDNGSGNVSGNVSGTVSGSVGGGVVDDVGGGVGEVSDMSEAGEATMVRNTIKRARTPAPSPAPAYPVPNLYSATSHYYETLPKRLMR